MYRLLSRGQYINNFDFLNYGASFPSNEINGRNAVYRFRKKEYTGEYSYNKNLIAFINGVESEIPYKVISINYFELITNKMTDLVMNNDISIKTGDIERDKKILKLVERTNWRDSIRKAFKMCTVYGDVVIKTYVNGASVTAPTHCFKVVDKHDINRTLAYVLYEPLYSNLGGKSQLRYIRFEIHFKGKIYECIRDYVGNGFGGGTVGASVDIEFNGRRIPREGIWYDSGVNDKELVQWLSINTEADGVYGQSIYQDIQDIVFTIEQRVSVNNHLLDSSIKPFIVVGMDMVERNETEDGRTETHLKLVNGNIMVSSGDVQAKSIELNYNLTNSENMIAMLQGYLYELSEMGKTFLSGEYSGNISEETLNNTIKSAIDKGNRLITELYTGFRDSLYCLCVLNGININIEDLTLVFNIGRTDDDQKVADVCEKLINGKILSKRTVREKYFGYNSEQSDSEDRQIELENSSMSKDNENDYQQDSNNDNKDDEIDKKEYDKESNDKKDNWQDKNNDSNT